MRTRALLAGALGDLLADRALEDVTVSELCRRAGVNRATFYGHWPDQRAFAAEVFTALIDGISDIPPRLLAQAAGPREARALYADAVVAELRHVRENRPVLRALFGSDSDAGFRRRLTEAMRHRVDLALEQWRRFGVLPADAAPLTSVYVAGGLVAVLAEWACSDAEDEEQLAAVAAQVATLLPSWWPAR